MVTRLAEVPLTNGYYLPNWFSIVLPEATENLVLNPSVETNTTGYTAVGAGAAISRTLSEQRRGAYSLQITPAAGVASGVYYGTITLTAGTAYTLSLDVKGVPGHVYNIYFASNAGAQIGSPLEFVGTGYWQRVKLSYPETATLARRFYIVQDASDTQPFYVDGWQVEAKPYATTYTDGDLEGFVIGEVAYYWTGTFHGSSSVRAATTRSGGQLVNLSEYGFNLLGAVGLGLAPVNNFSLPSNLGGAFYQNTVEGVRQFTIVGDMNTANYYTLSAQKAALEQALSYNLTPYRQPLLLHFQETDDCGVAVGDEVYIKCVYQTGAEGNTDNLNAENFPLQFTAYDREGMYIDGEYALPLSYNVTIAHNNISRISPSGEWSTFGVGANAPINAIEIDANGDIYIGGEFTSIAGVAANRVAVFRNGAWAALGVGVDNDVYALALRNGKLYVGGVFLNAGGAGAARIAAWDISTSTWAALGAGLTGGAAPSCFTIFINSDNSYLYAGGGFTSAGGAAASRIARWNLSTLAWSTLPMAALNGVSDVVYDIESNNLTDIWCTGAFQTAAGVVVNHIARWNTSNNWYALTTGLGVAGATYGTKLLFSPNAELYVAGLNMQTAGGVTCMNLAAWNGSSWRGLFCLPTSLVFNTSVQDMGFDKFGYLHWVGAGADPGGMAGNESIIYGVIAPQANNSINIMHAYRAYGIRSTALRGIGSAIQVNAPGGVIIAGEYGYIQTGLANIYENLFQKFPKFIIDNSGTVWPCLPLTIENYIDMDAISFSKSVAVGEMTNVTQYRWESNFGDRTAYLSNSGANYSIDSGTLPVYVMASHYYTITGDNNAQTAEWWLMTGISAANTALGRIYVNVVDDGAGFFHLNIFSNVARTNLIGHTASYNATGFQAVIPDGSSGLGGYVYIKSVVAADVDIVVRLGILNMLMQYRETIRSLSQARYS